MSEPRREASSAEPWESPSPFRLAGRVAVNIAEMPARLRFREWADRRREPRWCRSRQIGSYARLRPERPARIAQNATRARNVLRRRRPPVPFACGLWTHVPRIPPTGAGVRSFQSPTRSEPLCRGAQYSAKYAWIQILEARNLHGRSRLARYGGNVASSSARRLAGQQQQRQQTVHFRVPMLFLSASVGCHVGQGMLDPRIVGTQQRQ